MDATMYSHLSLYRNKKKFNRYHYINKSYVHICSINLQNLHVSYYLPFTLRRNGLESITLLINGKQSTGNSPNRIAAAQTDKGACVNFSTYWDGIHFESGY